jgi:phosphonate degradation associated HDIG domain protein
MTAFELGGDPCAELEDLFARRGRLAYGEDVDQLAHALQGALLAERRGEGPALITAALLHDIGHMLHEDAAAALALGDDDAHEALGVHYLAKWFGRDVLAPIALHVEAKRYLAATEPGYLTQLSPVSQRTLAIQRGPMVRSEIAAFAANPHAPAAIRLRRIDEAAKVAGLATPNLRYYLAFAASCLRDRRTK